VLVEVTEPVLLPPDRWDFRLVDFWLLDDFCSFDVGLTAPP
jgi:hypothetical protein